MLRYFAPAFIIIFLGITPAWGTNPVLDEIREKILAYGRMKTLVTEEQGPNGVSMNKSRVPVPNEAEFQEQSSQIRDANKQESKYQDLLSSPDDRYFLANQWRSFIAERQNEINKEKNVRTSNILFSDN